MDLSVLIQLFDYCFSSILVRSGRMGDWGRIVVEGVEGKVGGAEVKGC